MMEQRTEWRPREEEEEEDEGKQRGRAMTHGEKCGVE